MVHSDVPEKDMSDDGARHGGDGVARGRHDAGAAADARDDVPDGGAHDREFRITVVSAGISEPSSTTKLANAVALKAAEYLRGRGAQTRITLIDLKKFAADIAVASTSYQLSPDLRSALATVRASDGIVAASPVAQASYSGLFKSFWDVAETDLIIGMPVALTATGGSERHALVPDSSMRQLFAFFRAIVVPTSVMAASGDWGNEELSRHVLRAGNELAAVMVSDARRVMLDAAGAHYERSFDAGASADGDAQGPTQQLDFDSALMRLAAGGLPTTSGAAGTTGAGPAPMSRPEGSHDASMRHSGAATTGETEGSHDLDPAWSAPANQERPHDEKTPAAAGAGGGRPSGKARHNWSKAVSAVEFHIDAYGSKATVEWRKRNEMVIRRGAVLRPEAPLNKDGSLGFDARFGATLRSEHAGQLDGLTTTEDVVLKSVNEVGLFLYFGGTNGWLMMRDDQGRSIHDWTVVR